MGNRGNANGEQAVAVNPPRQPAGTSVLEKAGRAAESKAEKDGDQPRIRLCIVATIGASIQILYAGRLECLSSCGFDLTVACASSDLDTAIRTRGVRLRTFPFDTRGNGLDRRSRAGAAIPVSTRRAVRPGRGIDPQSSVARLSVTMSFVIARRQQPCRLSAHPKVRQVGWKSNVLPLMAAMDVVVLATHREGLGNVLLRQPHSGFPPLRLMQPGGRTRSFPKRLACSFQPVISSVECRAHPSGLQFNAATRTGSRRASMGDGAFQSD